MVFTVGWIHVRPWPIFIQLAGRGRARLQLVGLERPSFSWLTRAGLCPTQDMPVLAELQWFDVRFWNNSTVTRNVTGRHRGPKWMLQAGYRAPSLQCLSSLCKLLFCEASSIFHRRVWYRVLYLDVCMLMLCMYSTFGHHPHPLGYPCAKFRLCGTLHCWASPRIKIAYSIIHSMSHSLAYSPSLFDRLAAEAYRFGTSIILT